VSHFWGLDFLNEIQAVNWIFSSPLRTGEDPDPLNRMKEINITLL
jgi:hypothetical protein